MTGAVTDAPIAEESPAQRLRFAWLITAACVLLTVPRLLLHELWRDEAWLWLVVTEARSLADLFTPLARSGQGYLFPILCYLARQVSTSPRAMQFVHLVLVGAAAFVFARWAPMRRRERALFVFGYFPFYEYAVISRHYVAGVLLMGLACAAAASSRKSTMRSRKSTIFFAAAIGLLCQTTVYGFIIAMAIVCGWLFDRWIRRRELTPLSRTEIAASLVLAMAGVVAGIIQLIPEPGTSFMPWWRFDWDAAHAGRVLTMPWRAFVPLLQPKVQFWNSNVLDAWPRVEAIAGLPILALAAALLWRRKAALLTFGVGVIGFLAFGYVKFHGLTRHQGHLWLLFAAALWIGGQSFRESWRSRVLSGFLILHCAAAIFASWIDLRHPFSNGPATAALIRRERLDQHPLLGHREPPAASVALPLGKPLYSPSRRLFVTHPDWGPEQRELDEHDLRCAARELARQEGKDIVLVMSNELSAWEELEPAGAVVGAILSSEDYHLYRMHHGRLAQTEGAAKCP